MTTHGAGMAAAWEALANRTAAGASWQPEDGSQPFFAAAIPETYSANPAIPRNLVHFMDRGALIAVDAALQAIESAGLGAGAGDSRRFAVADGLAYRAPGQATLFVPYGHLVARVLGVRGPVLEAGGAEASGMAAIARAALLVAAGRAEIAVAGAAQALQPPLLEHLRAQGFAARSPACPFDVEHNGAAAAEGAAYVVIESEGHAAERGVTPIARIAGVADMFDSAAEPLAISDAAEAGRAMQGALADAGYLQNQVDLIVSCADGRPMADFAEGYGIKRTFGRHAYYAGVTTATGGLGWALAASGPLSVAVALEALRRQQSPPIAGFERAETDLDLAYLREAKAEKLETILVTSLGLGGTNVSLLLDSTAR